MNDSEKQPSRSPYPSRLTLPEAAKPYPTLLEFLVRRYPYVDRVVWNQRLQSGQIVDATGQSVYCDRPYQPGLVLIYYREVYDEVMIPYEETVIFNNDNFLVCCKPHFLPVTPGGRYVNECLVYRLRQKLGIDDLVPLHVHFLL